MRQAAQRLSWESLSAKKSEVLQFQGAGSILIKFKLFTFTKLIIKQQNCCITHLSQLQEAIKYPIKLKHTPI